MNPIIIEKPSRIISEDILTELLSLTSEEGQVIIHGIFISESPNPCNIRIWPTTFLFDLHSDHMSQLVHSEKISKFPDWTNIPAGSEFIFTLVFSPLPKSCSVFDLQEMIPQSGGFSVPNIRRNKSDVYFLDFS